MHANFFYKNIIWTGCLFWYCIYNEWEATYLFECAFLSLPSSPCLTSRSS
jgi:magnesium-transporting ATPase (P-type)